jgi:hypothetical protein
MFISDKCSMDQVSIIRCDSTCDNRCFLKQLSVFVVYNFFYFIFNDSFSLNGSSVIADHVTEILLKISMWPTKYAVLNALDI